MFIPYRSRSDLAGLNTEHSIAITFHCILPTMLWEWDETSRMYMRFEAPDLGKWEDNVGEFRKGRYVIE